MLSNRESWLPAQITLHVTADVSAPSAIWIHLWIYASPIHTKARIIFARTARRFADGI